MSSSIQDEFKVFKDELRKLNIEVQKVVKVGNGSMDFHEVFYKSPRYQEVKSIYVQRHNLDSMIENLNRPITKIEIAPQIPCGAIFYKALRF